MQQLDKELFPMEEVYAAELNPALVRKAYERNLTSLNNIER